MSSHANPFPSGHAPGAPAVAPAHDRGLAGRLLALAGDDQPGLAPDRLTAFARILLGIVALDQWHGLEGWGSGAGLALHLAVAVGVSACAAWAWRRRALRRSAALAAGLLAVDLAAAFPDHANHQYVALLCATFVALFDPDAPEEAATSLAGLRWLVAIGLAWAGLQKLLWGYYFDGTFLSYVIAQRESFALAFGWILPDAEVARLVALPIEAGAGPFRAESLGLDALANATWIAEIGLAVGLLVAPVRAWAAVGAMALVAIIECAAREVFFGLLMFDLLILFLPGRAGPRSLPAFAFAGAVLLASRLGWLPPWTYT